MSEGVIDPKSPDNLSFDELIEKAENDPDFPSIGPECYTNRDRTVICYKGENFYRACDKLVYDYPPDDPSGHAQSHCVKRIDHPGVWCEDYNGRLRSQRSGLVLENEASRSELELPVPRMAPTSEPITMELIQAVWTEFVAPLQRSHAEAGAEILPPNLRALMAILRTLNDAMIEKKGS